MCFIAQAHCSKYGLYARAASLSPVTANLRGLAQQRRIFPPEHLGAEPHGCIDLRLSETAIGIAGMAQPLEQLASRAVAV